MSKSRQQKKRKARKQAVSVETAAVKPAKRVPWTAILLGTTAVLILAALLGHSVLANARLSVTPVKYRPVSFSSSGAADENIKTRYTYDGLGSVTSITAVNPTTGNQVTRYLYEDPYDATLPTSIIYPDSSDTTSAGTDQVKISYFLDRKIKAITDQNGTVRTFSYDPQRRLAADTITTLGAGVDGTVRKIARTYNWFGAAERITSLDVSNNILNEVMYTFDSNQRLLRIYQSHVGAVNTATTPYVEYGYSTLIPGRLVSVTYPGGRQLTYNYDALGRIDAISEGNQVLVSYGIDGAGNLLQVTYDEPGLSLDYTNGGIERFGRVADLAWKKNSVDLIRISHDYDYAGNRLNRRDVVNPSGSELYAYDQVNQLALLARGPLNLNGTAVTAQSFGEAWQYDKTGNWVEYDHNGTIENRTHNAANEIQTICSHDANGNMTVMPGLKAKYDAWNRIVEVRDSSNNLIANYAYNGVNQRIKQTVDSTITKSFFNEKWQELESHTGETVTAHVWGLRYIDDLICRDRPNERLYSLTDSNWSVVAVVDATGAIQERYAYDGFGKRHVFDASFVARPASDYAWNRAFTGQVLDGETGMMNSRHRYYHCTLGRFTTRDPLSLSQPVRDLYAYTSNNPVRYVDSFGLEAEEKCPTCNDLLSNANNLTGGDSRYGKNPLPGMANKCNVNIFCSDDCGLGNSGLSGITQASEGYVHICIKNGSVPQGPNAQQQFNSLLLHEMQHAQQMIDRNKKLCQNSPYTGGTPPFQLNSSQSCSNCQSLEAAAYRVQCAYLYGNGGPWYRYCIDRGVYESCKHVCPNEKEPSKPSVPEPPYQDGL